VELVISISFPLVRLRTGHAMVWLGNLIHLEREACSTENKVRPTDQWQVVGLLSLPVTHTATSKTSSANSSNFW